MSVWHTGVGSRRQGVKRVDRDTDITGDGHAAAHKSPKGLAAYSRIPRTHCWFREGRRARRFPGNARRALSV